MDKYGWNDSYGIAKFKVAIDCLKGTWLTLGGDISRMPNWESKLQSAVLKEPSFEKAYMNLIDKIADDLVRKQRGFRWFE